jgi:hypothetical protein
MEQKLGVQVMVLAGDLGARSLIFKEDEFQTLHPEMQPKDPALVNQFERCVVQQAQLNRFVYDPARLMTLPGFSNCLKAYSSYLTTLEEFRPDHLKKLFKMLYPKDRFIDFSLQEMGKAGMRLPTFPYSIPQGLKDPVTPQQVSFEESMKLSYNNPPKDNNAPSWAHRVFFAFGCKWKTRYQFMSTSYKALFDVRVSHHIPVLSIVNMVPFVEPPKVAQPVAAPKPVVVTPPV